MNIFESLVEVELKDPENDSDFLKVKETLTRIGISSKDKKTLYQSCHILHKQGRYYIVHFLEMFAIDGKGRGFLDEDRARRNTIAHLLEQWGLVRIVNSEICTEPLASMRNICVIPFKEKENFNLVSKYRIGNTK